MLNLWELILEKVRLRFFANSLQPAAPLNILRSTESPSNET
jgi:hypothetical protein